MVKLADTQGLGPCIRKDVQVQLLSPAPKNMYQVYILKSLKDSRTYTGHAQDALERLKDHNSGKVKATSKRRPLEIVYLEDLIDLKTAKQRELYWKSGAGRRKLQYFYQHGFPPLKLKI